MKRVLFAAMMALVIAGCGQNTPKNAEAETTTDAVTTIAIGDLVSDPIAYGDKVVRIEGVIDHMCRHSGDKMRVKETGSDLSIEVMLGEMASQFNVEMEGRELVLEGLLQYVVANKEELGEEAPKPVEGEETEEHSCDSEKAAAEALKAKGIDPSISAFITIAKYELK
jgi:ABC-type amino acid transport substrate-binding protein